MLDGQPVEGATVIFEQQGGKVHAASGFTDKDGIFYLGTFQPGDGAFPGDYLVLIEPPLAMPKERPTPGMSMGEAMALYAKFLKEQREHPDPPFGANMASVYRDPNRTPLRQTVPPTGPIIFEVTAEPNAKKAPARPKKEANPMEPPKPLRKR
jgi:hypothetical protein